MTSMKTLLASLNDQELIEYLKLLKRVIVDCSKNINRLKVLLDPSQTSKEEQEFLKADINEALAAYNRILSILPPGVIKEHIHFKVRRKEWELQLLSNNAEALNPVIVLDCELQIGRLLVQIKESQALEFKLLSKYPSLA